MGACITKKKSGLKEKILIRRRVSPLNYWSEVAKEKLRISYRKEIYQMNERKCRS